MLLDAHQVNFARVPFLEVRRTAASDNYVFTRELRPREVTRGDGTDLIAVSTKPQGVTTHDAKMDTRASAKTRSLVQ